MREAPGRIVWLAPLAVGVLLRLWYVHDQPLLDDEVAAVRATLALDAPRLLVTWGKQDFFQLGSALARLLLDLGLPLRELTFRIPALLTGFAAIWVLGRWAARRLGFRTGWLLAWLVAISPLLVIYSRLARSYLPMTLLATMASWRLIEAVRKGERRAFFEAAIVGSIAAWCHLLAIPFLAGAFAAAGMRLARDRSEVAQRGREAFAGALLAGLLVTCCWLLPGAASLAEQLATKAGAARFSVESWSLALHYFAGSRRSIVAALFWLVAAAGAARLWRRDRDLVAILLAGIAMQVVCVALLSPFGSNFELVLTRYLLVTLPSVLLFVATAAAAAVPSWSPGLWGAVVAAASLFVIGTGPLPGIFSGRSSLAHHNVRLRFVRAPEPPRDLSTITANPLVERAEIVGWIVPRLASGSFRTLEQIDRSLDKRLVLVELERKAPAGAIAFRNASELDPARLREVGVAVVGVRKFDFPYTPERRKQNLQTPRSIRLEREEAFREMVTRLGTPAFQDAEFALWDLR